MVDYDSMEIIIDYKTGILFITTFLLVYLIHFFKLRLIICVYCQICFPFIAIFFCPRYYYLRNIIENFIYIG